MTTSEVNNHTGSVGMRQAEESQTSKKLRISRAFSAEKNCICCTSNVMRHMKKKLFEQAASKRMSRATFHDDKEIIAPIELKRIDCETKISLVVREKMKRPADFSICRPSCFNSLHSLYAF